MRQYAKILKEIVGSGSIKPSAREGLPSTLSVFDRQIIVKPEDGLPILMGKKVLIKNVISELLWFIKGNTNIKFLHDYGNHIWDDDAYRYYRELGGVLNFETLLEKVDNPIAAIDFNSALDNKIPKNYNYGDCGKIYGHQWRNQDSQVDQLGRLIFNLIEKPFSRYHIVDAWNWKDTIYSSQALPACHTFFQCNVRQGRDDKYLDLSMWQRSCDMFLGVPYNLLSYGILHRILCRITGYKLGTFVWHGADCHVYENQLDAVNNYLNRVDNKLPRNEAQCIISTRPFRNTENNMDVIDEIQVEDISIINYNPLSYISAPLSTGVNKYKKE